MKKDLKIGEGRPGWFARFIWWLGCVLSRRIFNKALNLEFQNYDILHSLAPPYLIVGNHVTNYDPVIISSNQKHLIHWVANDAVFRHPLVRWVLRHIQTIPKTKGMSDLDTVRIMHQKVREGGVVGLFPEGRTCWDGKTQPVMPATGKLIKLLKVPVVSVVIRRGYLTQPRWVWAKNKRKSRILLEANLLFTQEEIKNLSLAEIEQHLEQGLANDDFQFQKDHPVPLESEKRGEHLELFTYICPKCGRLEALRSKDNSVRCVHCQWEFSIDPYGQLPSGADFPFSDLAEWNVWQQKETRKRIRSYLIEGNQDDPLLEDRGVTLLTGAGLVPLKRFSRGDIQLLKDRILFLPVNGDIRNFPLSQIEAVSIFKQQKFEFYHDRVLYRFHYQNPWDSAFKWLSFVEALLEGISGEGVRPGDGTGLSREKYCSGR